MFSILKNIKSNIKFDYKKADIDNWVFKLHYRLTFTFLVLAASFVYSFDLFGGKIKCSHSDTEEDSNKKINDAMNKYCFFMSLFTVPRHANKSVEDGEVVKPGIGAYSDGEEKTSLLWYQWVPYVLFLQGVAFYLPHYIWRFQERKRICTVLKQFDNLKLQDHLDEDKKEALFQQAYDDMDKHLICYRRWHIHLTLCEILNFVNVLIQMAVTDWYVNQPKEWKAFFGYCIILLCDESFWFLGGRFWTLGTKFYENYGGKVNYLDVVFPKVGKCILRRFGPAGSIQTHDFLCILPMNIVNEKFFVILWYWYIFVVTCSALMLLHRLLSFMFYSTRVQYNAQVLTHAMMVKPELRDVLLLVERLSYGEWFFLHYLISNLDPIIAAEMLSNFSNRLVQRDSRQRPGFSGIVHKTYANIPEDTRQLLMSDTIKKTTV